MFTFHRADFQQCLLRSLPASCRTHCSKRLKSYSQQPTGSVELVFEDKSTAVCDLLIGADGLKSAVRKTFIKEKVAWAGSRGRVNEAAEYDAAVDPVWTGTVAYRALISPERLRSCAPDHPIFSAPIQNYYLGKDSYVIAYPISRGKFINFAAFTTQPDLEDTVFDGPWFSPVEKEAFTGLFTSWETEVQQLISNIDKPLRWAIHTVKPLKSFVSGSVVLIGDAAHAMTPYLGSGAGQALEDAYILASLLGHRATTPQTLHHALHVYDEIRRPKALKVAEKSRRLGQCFMLHDYDFQGISQEAVSGELKLVGEEIARLSEWTWNTPIDGLVEEALNMLLRNTALE
ncbi:hypothetical protein H0H81_011674 [Sphagnurus paluster]|uniref:FAD-binding domain-containing protein n=1 Tax=Sphagnurus paluster TaxID=117069 RepID=A0A9P7FUX5_9AGAR|nr:hypothetical protein H0H81_011674 [Sphagnurus paluster]